MKTLIMTLVSFIFFSVNAFCQNSQAKDHAKLQNSVSFEVRMRENKGFTVSSAKGAKRAKKASNRKKARRERKANRRDQILESIKD